MSTLMIGGLLSGAGGGSAADLVADLIQPADQLSNLNNTLVSSNTLSVALEANKNYYVEMILVVRIRDIAADAKVQLAAITGATVSAWSQTFAPSNVSVDIVGAPITVTSGSIGNYLVHYYALVEMGGTAGNLTVQFAQNTTTATAGAEAALKRGSRLIVKEAV